MSNLSRAILLNKKVLERTPVVRDVASRLLLGVRPVVPADVPAKTSFANSYSLISEKNSQPFRKIMDHMDCYIGAGFYGPNKHWEYPWVLSNLELSPGLKVLDAGCGTSPPQYVIAGLGCKTHGIDPNEGVEWHGINRSLAKRFGREIEYRVEGLAKISYPDNHFDRVCCISVIEHCRVKPYDNPLTTVLTDDDRALHRTMMSELIRVTKPGGLLVLTTDYYFPRSNCLATCNVDIANLMAVDGVTVHGNRCDERFPGEDGFSPSQLIDNGDIDIANHGDILQTSIGLTFRKDA